VLSAAPHLQTLECGFIGSASDGERVLSRAPPYSPIHLVVAELGQALLFSPELNAAFCAALARSRLTKLALGYCQLWQGGVAVAQALLGHPTVSSLCLFGDDEVGGQALSLVSLVAESPILESLDLRDCHLSQATWQRFWLAARAVL
jgi:hypothetical protein